MFTGLIEDIGRVVGLTRASGGARLTVQTRLAAEHPRLGDSIAVQGACLTITAIRGHDLDFDVSLESIDRTALSALSPGDKVHLERALQLGGRLDGHLVQGHVDGVGLVVGNTREGDGWRLTVALPERLLGQVVEKGSIAIDGVSLTIASLVGDRVSVAVVPLTAEKTLLAARPVGTRVNIETDILGKYVERLLGLGGAARPHGGVSESKGVTLAMLGESGFLK